MGSNETATATTGGPRVIDVFDGNGAPSGPNYLLFSVADRPLDALWDRSGVWSSPRPRAPVLGARQRGLDPKLAFWVTYQPAETHLGRCISSGKRPRTRRRRLHVYSTDPKRPRGDLRTTN